MSMAAKLFLAVFFAALSVAASAERFSARWFFMARAVVSMEDVAFITNTVAKAADCGYNGMMLAGMDNVGIWPDWRRRRLQVIRRFCADKGVEIVPMVWSIGYGTMLDRDLSLAEGQEVASVPYVRRGGRAVFCPDGGSDVLAGDGGFENVEVRGSKKLPAGWDAWDHVGTVVAMDSETSRSGGRSMRLSRFDVSDGGQARLLHKPLGLRPGRQYAVTGYMKASADFSPRSALRVMAMQNGSVITLTSVLTRKGAADWTRFSVPIVLGEEGDISLYIGTWEAKSGTVWIDDVCVEDLGICGVLRRGGCPFTVADAETGRVYREGVDYDEVRSVKSIMFPKEPQSLELSIPAGSAMREGGRLLVSGYVPVTVKGGSQCSTCMSEESLYRHFLDSAKGVKAELGPKTWMISMDEIRMGGTCAACRARNTDMAHILGDCVTRQRRIIKQVSPDARICMWSDMFNPAQNAKERYYYCRGSFVGSWRLIPHDIVMVDWYGRKFSESLPFWRSEGFDVIVASYYDESMEKRTVPDVTIAAAQPNVLGAVYTTWRGDYANLRSFAETLRQRR